MAKDFRPAEVLSTVGGPALQGAAVSSDQPQGESSQNQDRALPPRPRPRENWGTTQASPRSAEKWARGRPPKIRQLWTLLRDPHPSPPTPQPFLSDSS